MRNSDLANGGWKVRVLSRVAFHLVSDDTDIIRVRFLNQFSSASWIVLFLGIYSPFIVSFFKLYFSGLSPKKQLELS